jgi:hypothetical protein
MIVFDLSCAEGHRFEGWFGSSGDFADQQERGMVSCPHCGSDEVMKAPMAPAVPKKGNQQVSAPSGEAVPMSTGKTPPEVAKALKQLAEAQKQALKNSTWVGDKFTEQSRAMHYGEREAAAIHGQASMAEAKALMDEGVSVAPLPFPIAPPDEIN